MEPQNWAGGWVVIIGAATMGVVQIIGAIFSGLAYLRAKESRDETRTGNSDVKEVKRLVNGQAADKERELQLEKAKTETLKQVVVEAAIRPTQGGGL